MTGRFALTLALALAAPSACAVDPPSLAPLPAAPPTCPADGCQAVALASSGGAPRGACSSPGVAPCGGAPAGECRARALAEWNERQGDSALPCVARMLSDACTGGDAEACGFAGRLWLDGRGVEADVERGLVMLADGCDGGFVPACSVALAWLGDPAHKSDADDIGDLRTRLESESGCWTGQADMCLQAGRLYRSGVDGVDVDLARSAVALARGCDYGERLSCTILGVAFTYGEGVTRDLERAVALYERSCRLGLPLGSANLGYMAEHGAGMARDNARARALYRAACQAGESYGCRHAEMIDAEASGVPRDPAGELAYWTRSCEVRRDARACAFLSLLYLDGPDGLAHDEAKSAQALTRSCHLGYRRACEWLRESEDE